MNVQTAVKTYLANRAAAEAAKAEVAAAEAVLKEAFAKAGVESAVDVAAGVKVSVVQGERPNYDANLLAELVDGDLLDADTFDRVTKVAVDTKAFQAAQEIGLISEVVAEKVTKVTPYEQVRVATI